MGNLETFQGILLMGMIRPLAVQKVFCDFCSETTKPEHSHHL